MTARPLLWFTEDDVRRWRELLAEGQPTVTGIHRAAAQAAQEMGDDEAAIPAINGGALVCLLDDDGAAGKAAAARWLAWVASEAKSDLKLARRALVGAQVASCSWSVLTGAERAALVAALVDLCHRLQHIGKGNPHQVGNNWWAVTHGGLLLAAQAADGQALPDGTTADLQATIDLARGRLLAFCRHFGDAGIYHEGLGYQGYVLEFLLPTIIACRQRREVDFLQRFPCLRNMPASLVATLALRRAREDSGPGDYGCMVSWNDAGQGWAGDGVFGGLLAIAPAAQMGALRTIYDRLCGSRSPEPDFGGASFGGWLATLCGYPFDHPPEDPDTVLPRWASDSRQGLVVIRDRYADGDDAVLGCYARATHIGGHSQDDAGSLRFMALGQDWILGGGQARGRPQWQSLVTRADIDKRGKPTPCGQLIWETVDDQGAVIGMDLRQASQCYHERYIAFRPDLDGGCGLALLDHIDDHQGGAFDWNLTFGHDLIARVDDDGAGIHMRAPDGSVGQWRFSAAVPDEIVIDTTPASQRTYSGGQTVHYPGRPLLRARFAAQPHLSIYAVLVVRRGSLPAISACGSGFDLAVDGTPWQRPFGAAIPAAFVPNQSWGLCRRTHGRPDPLD